MMLLLSSIAMMHDREAGYPLGGSLAFAQALADRYEAQGGQIHYKSRVERILVEDNRAVGVLTEDGSRTPRGHRDLGRATAGPPSLTCSMGAISIEKPRATTTRRCTRRARCCRSRSGSRATSPRAAHRSASRCAEPILLGNLMHDRLVVKHYCFDPSMAPAGQIGAQRVVRGRLRLLAGAARASR